MTTRSKYTTVFDPVDLKQLKSRNWMFIRLVTIVDKIVEFPRRVSKINIGQKLSSYVYLVFPMLNHANSQLQTSYYFLPIFIFETRRGNSTISSRIITYIMNIYVLGFCCLRSTGSNTVVHLLREVPILHVF